MRVVRIGCIGCGGGFLALVAGLGVLVVVLGGRAEEVATEGNALPPARIGEPLTLPKNGWVITVTGVRASPTVPGLFEMKRAPGVYLIVDLTLANTSKEAHTLGGDRFTLGDSQGRRFPYYREGTSGIGQKELGARINPGLTGPASIVFDVPKDATGLYRETVGKGRISLGDMPLP